MKTPAQTILSRALPSVFALILLAAALLPGAGLVQQPSAPTLTSNTKLVLVPFHVQRGKYFAGDLQPSDFILREDGHPRPFTTFEGPNTPHPTPLELILLFDTTPQVPAKENVYLSAWRNPKADYEFLNNWVESDTSAILQQNGMDIRMAVYHYSSRQLERLCDATSDPREIERAFHALLDPIAQGNGELALAHGEQVNKPTFTSEMPGWMTESIVATLKDETASPIPARRILIVFTNGEDGISSMSSLSKIVDSANALDIPIDPVIMDAYKMHDSSKEEGAGGELWTTPDKNVGLLPWITRAGESTGGQAYIPAHLNRETLAAILTVYRDTALSEYVVGFSPDPAPKPKKHSLDVKLASKSTGKMVGGEKSGVVY